MKFGEPIKQKLSGLIAGLQLSGDGTIFRKIAFCVLGILITFILIVGMYWSREPAEFSISQNTAAKLAVDVNQYVVGAATTSALIQVAETLLGKPGGYLTNDGMPPGVYLDNIPNW